MFLTIHWVAVKGDMDDISDGAADQGTASKAGDMGSEDFGMFLFRFFTS